MFFLLFLHDGRRIRIREAQNMWIRIRNTGEKGRIRIWSRIWIHTVPLNNGSGSGGPNIWIRIPNTAHRFEILLSFHQLLLFTAEAEPSGDYGKAEWAEHKLSMQREWERRRLSKAMGLLPSQKHISAVLSAEAVPQSINDGS